MNAVYGRGLKSWSAVGIARCLLPMVVGLCLAGCCTVKSSAPVVMKAIHADQPVKIDGKLDDEVWKNAPAYPLVLSKDARKEGKTLSEAGEARLAWDTNYIYIAVRFTDSDIVAEGKEDQLHHYSMGDLAEVFLKPENETWYWELYVTPANKKTTFFFPGRGRSVPSCFTDYRSDLTVAAQCDGTLNKWEDRDRVWTAEMAMPIKDLTSRGEKFEPGARWRILVSRYNYSRYLSNKELSMAPVLSKTNYHLIEEHAVLEILPKP